MSTRLFPQEFSEVIMKAQFFVNYSLKNINVWNNDYPIYDASFESLAASIIPFPSHLAEVFSAKQIGAKQEEVESFKTKVEKVLYDFERKMDSISFTLPAVDQEWQSRMMCIWRLFELVYQELIDVLGSFSRYTFSLYEKLDILDAIKS